jgi:nucleoside-diphosphate-sugar epimerase
MPSILIAGCGFVGRATAALFQEAGWHVAALTRSPSSAGALAGLPYRVAACDITRRESLAALGLQSPDAVVNCASAGSGGAEAYRQVYFEGTRNLLEVLRPKNFLFTSSTSVYPQNDGSLVTEESPAQPALETALVLRSTEEITLAYGGIVARLAGIYGPGRSMTLQKFFDGRAVIEDGGGRWINQIHRDDAAGAIFFLLNRGSQGGIYNVCDDTPLTQLEYYRRLAELFGKSLPPAGPAGIGGRRTPANKRVSNARLRRLGWQIKYPSFMDAVRNDPELLARI